MPVIDLIQDADLLARYVKEQCHTPDGREALGELTRRHLDFVFGVARRAVRDASLAEDVTQAVFLILARKAHTIRHAEHLGSWLFQTTRYTAANAVKMAARRSRHERRAAETRPRDEGADMQSATSDPELVYQLDNALAELPDAERDVILLRFYGGQEYAEIAAELNVSEPAARKRLSRGLERMRTILARRKAVSLAAMMAAISLASAERASATFAVDLVPAVISNTGSDTALALAAVGEGKTAAILGGVMAAVLALAMGGAMVTFWWPERPNPALPAASMVEQ